jgi:hypothetical protein
MTRGSWAGALSGAVLSLISIADAKAFVVCGFHERPLIMRAFHWNSEFWVDMVANEAGKWNAVHPVVSIDRERRSTVPAGRDNRNVIGWLSDASMQSAYGSGWGTNVGLTLIWQDGECGRIVEVDMMFNPSITLFSPQRQVPYSLGFQEIALHELGHALTLDHWESTLAVMTDGAAASNVLYNEDKVGWFRSAQFRFSPQDKSDMGIFPLRAAAGGKRYATINPSTVAAGSTFTVRDITVENLSSGISFPNPQFRAFVVPTSGAFITTLGTFTWASFCAFCHWGGDLTIAVPAGLPPGQYRLWIELSGSDSDLSNNVAQIGLITVP